MSSTAARYAQLRRDSESRSRQRLQQLVPQRYIDSVPEAEPKDNPATKIMDAAISYLEDLANDGNANSNNIAGDTAGDNPANTTNNQSTDAAQVATQTAQQSPQQSPFAPTAPTTPEKLKNNVEYQYLKQAFMRIKHNIQERDEGDEISGEVKQMMDESNDALVDIIQKWEGDRAENS